jgi:hypothetical protein
MGTLLAAERGVKNEHVLSGLIAKRAELAGRVEVAQREMRALVLAIDHIDASIRMFDPDIELDDIKPRLPPRHQAFKGEVSRLVLNAMRKAGKALPVSEITLHVLAGRGLTNEDRPFMRVLGRRVGACLRHLRKKGLVRLTRGDGQVGVWQIVG